MKKRVTVKTSKWPLIIVAFLLCLACARLIYVAVANNIDGLNLKEFAANRNTKTKTLYASRGTIFDRNGEALALSVNSYTLIAYLSSSRTTNPNKPQHVVDKQNTAKMLATVIDMSEEKILERLNQDKYQVEFGSAGKNITELLKKKIQELELPGIDFIESTQRYYKMDSFASYIIGYAKSNDDGEIKGELGIEKYYNTELSGTNGYITYQRDAYGYQLPNVPSITQDAKSGNNIYLTLDTTIQLIAENALKKLSNEYKFDYGVVTVMNAKTGAIVASATSPTYNPNNLNTITSYLNPLVSYEYEPGSTMKIFSWASAMEEGVYKGDETYKSGSIPVADVVIRDSNREGWGVITFDTGFVNSSNVAASILAERIGREHLREFYTNYGFGQKTGIELAGEVNGDISFYYPSEVANAAFGQGVTVSPIQMLQALSALTNDGMMIKPYIVDKIVTNDNTITYEGKRTEIRQTMQASTAQKMRELMHDVNYNGLTKKSKIWQPKTVSMGIKTGTAQIASPSGGYLTGKYDQIYSLAGIFPEENPEYIIYSVVSRIQGPQKAVANMVTSVVDEVAAFANLTSKNENNKKDIYNVADYTSKTVESLNLKDNKDLMVIGDGKYIINQYPLKGTKVASGTKIFLLTNSQKYVMPNMMGWSLSQAKTYCDLIHLPYNIKGKGYVAKQSIEEGTEITKDSSLTIELETKQ